MTDTTQIRVLYVDVDGTLVGPGGNLFLDGGHRFHLETAEAIGLAREAGLELVPLSGRARGSMGTLARLIGSASYIAELGAIRVYDHGTRVVLDQGAFGGDGPAVDELRRAAEGLVDRHAGRLEEHSPWNAARSTSFMVRGQLDLADARAWLESEGFAWADCVDNGVIPRMFETLADLDVVRVYHLTPKGVSKRAGVAADQVERGVDPSACAVIGDSHADLECHTDAGRVFIVANALDKDPELAPAVERVPNAEVTTRGYGLGFADVVRELVASR